MGRVVRYALFTVLIGEALVCLFGAATTFFLAGAFDAFFGSRGGVVADLALPMGVFLLLAVVLVTASTAGLGRQPRAGWARRLALVVAALVNGVMAAGSAGGFGVSDPDAGDLVAGWGLAAVGVAAAVTCIWLAFRALPPGVPS